MSKIGLVIAREFNERVRKRSFLITTILTPLLMVGLIGGMVAMMSLRSSDTKTIEVIDSSGVVGPRLEDAGTIDYLPTERTLEEINASHESTWGVLVVGPNVMTDPSDVRLYSYSSSTFEIEAAIAGAISSIIETEKLKGYDIEELPRIMAEVKTDVRLTAYKVDESGGEKESSSMLSMGLAYGLGFLMYMFVLLYGVQVMNGVIEEKNSKVLEVIVSSVRPFELMMGKIVGIACVAVTQFVIWVAVIAVFGTIVVHRMVPEDILAAAQSMSATGGVGADGLGMPTGTPAAEMGADMSALVDNPEAVAALGSMMDLGYIVPMLAVFLVFFAGGYLLYAAAFAAVGSAVDNVQDSQQFQMPITLPLVFGMIGMINAMQDPNGPIAFWLSLVPFTSPMVMVERIPYGVPAWQLALSIALLVATFVAMVWLAGKIYRVGIFMYGKKPSLRELAKWISYKS
ncbi:MAG: ABC transporter permease [Alistipes sp.]|jgi:ABC-2 type transport system permease protein|nr:ABC transporter permease [Alistipes sp.]